MNHRGTEGTEQFRRVLIITKNGLLMLKDFTKLDQVSATANGSGTLYIENGVLNVVP